MSLENKKIKNTTVCNFNNIEFKSQFEKTVYKCLSEQGFNPQYEPFTFTLWESFQPITPFYDKETSKHREKRLKQGDVIKEYLLVAKDSKIVGIRYTPDFYFKYKDIDVFIEAKGIENDVFYIKKKLFRYYLDQQLIKHNKKSIFFEVYTKKNVLQAISILKDYEKSFNSNLETN